MNKLVQVSRYSDELSGLEILERPIPQPATGEVLVRVSLRPINPAGAALLALLCIALLVAAANVLRQIIVCNQAGVCFIT